MQLLELFLQPIWVIFILLHIFLSRILKIDGKRIWMHEILSPIIFCIIVILSAISNSLGIRFMNSSPALLFSLSSLNKQCKFRCNLWLTLTKIFHFKMLVASKICMPIQSTWESRSTLNQRFKDQHLYYTRLQKNSIKSQYNTIKMVKNMIAKLNFLYNTSSILIGKHILNFCIKENSLEN